MRQGQQLRAWQIGDVVAERYEILEYLGTGGMGVVYRCREVSTGRIRAIKTLRPDLDEGTRALVRRFLQAEAEALSKVESDFVVRIFDADVGQSTNDPFVVMELLRGRDLEQVLRDGPPIATDYALTLLWQAACALNAIHGQNIVHRDMKPANLFVNNRQDGSTELKVLDFSISRLLDRVTGRTTMIVGTRGYMAPEQAAGYDVDHRADVYALGQVARAVLASTDDRFLRWHAKATASDRRVRFNSATEAVESLAVALDLPLPNHRSNRPTHTSLTSATTVVARSGIGVRRRFLYGGALGLVAAAAALWRYVDANGLRDKEQPSGYTGVPATVAPSAVPSVPARPPPSELEPRSVDRTTPPVTPSDMTVTPKASTRALVPAASVTPAGKPRRIDHANPFAKPAPPEPTATRPSDEF